MLVCPPDQSTHHAHPTRRLAVSRFQPPSAPTEPGLALLQLARLLWLPLSLGIARAQDMFSGPPARSGSSGWGRVPGLSQDMLVVLGTGAILLLLLLVWARFLRKKPHSHSMSSPGNTRKLVGGDGSDHGHRQRHRRKRRRREHRSLNPTLAETGGLPPPRPESQPPRAT